MLIWYPSTGMFVYPGMRGCIRYHADYGADRLSLWENIDAFTVRSGWELFLPLYREESDVFCCVVNSYV